MCFPYQFFKYLSAFLKTQKLISKMSAMEISLRIFLRIQYYIFFIP